MTRANRRGSAAFQHAGSATPKPPAVFRGAVRVTPGATRESVGGQMPPTRPGDPPALLVRVCAKPIGGQATTAVEVALARALGLSRRQVSVVRGAASRDKLVEISDCPPDLPARWARLLGLSAGQLNSPS